MFMGHKTDTDIMAFIFKNNFMFLRVYVWMLIVVVFVLQVRLAGHPFSQFSLTLLGSEPSSSLSTHTEEDLVFRMMMDNHKRPLGSEVHSTTTTSRGEISANELGMCVYFICVISCWAIRYFSPTTQLTHFSFLHIATLPWHWGCRFPKEIIL